MAGGPSSAGRGALTPRVLLEIIIFVLTGIVSTLTGQILIYAGIPAWSGLLPLFNYAGMCFASVASAYYLGAKQAASSSAVDKEAGGGNGGGGAGGGATQQPTPAALLSAAAAALSLLPSASFTSTSASAMSDEDGVVGVVTAGEAEGGATPSASASSSLQRRTATTAVSAAATPSAVVATPTASYTSTSSAAQHLPFSISVQAFVPCAVSLDLLGFYLHVKGMQLAGSALFQVLYASVVVWAALGSRILRGPKDGALNRLQLLGVAIVLVGLAYSGLAESGGGGHGEGGHAPHAVRAGGGGEAHGAIVLAPLQPGQAGGAAVVIGEGAESAAAATLAAAANTMLGVAASLGSAVVYGAVYALSECLMSGPQAPAPATVATYVGCGITAVLGLYIAVFVLPRGAELSAAVAAAGLLTWPAVGACCLVMMASALMHSIAYYGLLPSVGAAAVGLMSAARAVGVFAFSAVFFCGWQASQCFTLARGITTVVVLSGILVFSQGKQQQQRDSLDALAGADTPGSPRSEAAEKLSPGLGAGSGGAAEVSVGGDGALGGSAR